MSSRPADPPCPMCGGTAKLAYTAGDRNWRITEERFRYLRCDRCKSIFIAAAPEDPARYYASGYHPFDEQGEPRWRGIPALLQAEAWRVATLRRIGAAGRLVDVGAGAGGFASAAVEGGFAVTAIEMDAECCRFMGSSLGVEAICTDRPVAALGALPPMDVVTMWHVLEHLPEPVEVLRTAVAALAPGGTLALAVPNPRSIQARVLGPRWAHLDAPRHLCLPSGQALRAVAAEHGLRVVLATTSDPSGLACDTHGWIWGLRRQPSQGAPGRAALAGGEYLTRIISPLERRGERGAALTLFFTKP